MINFTPEPNGKQRSFNFLGYSGRKVTSFGIQSVGGSISWTSEYVSTDDETKKTKKNFTINRSNKTDLNELHLLWHSFENNKVQQLNHYDVLLVLDYHPRNNKNCFSIEKKKERNLPL